jgi:hypothetical protein
MNGRPERPRLGGRDVAEDGAPALFSVRVAEASVTRNPCPEEVVMAKPIAATPVLRGEDARRIQDELRLARPVDLNRKNAQKADIRKALKRFKLVSVLPTGQNKPMAGA